jgi:hypothetical protein
VLEIAARHELPAIVIGEYLYGWRARAIAAR